MAYEQNNDLMTRFYLSSSSVQHALLDDYQQLAGNIRKELSFLDFLGDNFETKVILDKAYSSMTIRAYPQVSV